MSFQWRKNLCCHEGSLFYLTNKSECISEQCLKHLFSLKEGLKKTVFKHSSNWYLDIELMLRITGIWTRAQSTMVEKIWQPKSVGAPRLSLNTGIQELFWGAKLSQHWKDGVWLLPLISTGVSCWHIHISSRLSILCGILARCSFWWNTGLCLPFLLCYVCVRAEKYLALGR